MVQSTCRYCGKPQFYEDMGGPGSFVWIHSNEKDADTCPGPPPVGDGYDLPDTLSRWKRRPRAARAERWTLDRYREHAGMMSR